MGEYYRRVLRADPENPLLLRNYGTYLHDAERDLAAAEACYARALLAAPGDADLLSLYGSVIWEARHEKERAEVYLQRAVQAAPDDWYVPAIASVRRSIRLRLLIDMLVSSCAATCSDLTRASCGMPMSKQHRHRKMRLRVPPRRWVPVC
jgi:tetratricopeptide (TPR) repeat protein